MLLHGGDFQVQIKGLGLHSANFNFRLRRGQPRGARRQLVLSIRKVNKFESPLGIGLPLVQNHQGTEKSDLRLRNWTAAGIEDCSNQSSRLRGGC